MATVQTGIATSFIDFTRASNATVTDSDGLVKWAPHNLLTNSENFDAAAWIKPQATVAANSIAAPNGTSTADTILDTAVSNIHYVAQSITAYSPVGLTLTVSAFCKAGTLNYATVGVTDISVGNLYAVAVFNLSSGTLATSGAVGTGYSIVGTPTITFVGSGWYLCTVTVVVGTSASFLHAAIGANKTGVITASAGGFESYLGNGSGIYAWGAHVYRSDLGGMQPNTSAYPMYNPTTPKNLLGFTESFASGWTGTNGGLQSSGVEVVTNGTFASDVSGWTALNGGSIAWSSGAAVVTGAGANTTGVYQPITCVIGKTYRFQATCTLGTATVAEVAVNATAVGSGGSLGTTYGYLPSSQTFVGYFTATATTHSVVLMPRGVGLTATFDNVTVQEVVAYEAPNGLQTARAVEATSANGTLLSSLSLLASPYTFSVWLKRKTGSGNVQLTVDGTTYATVSVTDTWTRFSTTLTPTAGTKTPGIRLVTSGDAVYAWGAQLSDSASLDPYVPDYGAANTSAAYYGPRRDFDSAGVCKGLLVEEQRSNLVLQSAMGTALASWQGNGSTRTLSTEIAPDGTQSAMQIVVTANSGLNLSQSIATVVGQIYTSSMWLKGTSGQKIYFLATDSAAAQELITFTGSWQRVTKTFTATGTTSFIGCEIFNRSGGAHLTNVTFNAWGAQYELGSFATSYIPTGAATATRNADVASVSTQAFPYSSTAGSFVVNFQTFGVAANNPRLIGTELASDVSLLFVGSAVTVGTWNGSVALSVTGSNNTVVPLKAAIAHDGSGRAVCYAAGTVQSDANTAPSFTSMRIGSGNGGSTALNGHIRQITYLPRRISNTELQTRTA